MGDNVGDIAGMGADLFGSFAESTCAALVVAAVSSLGVDHNLTGMYFPLLISSEYHSARRTLSAQQLYFPVHCCTCCCCTAVAVQHVLPLLISM